MSEPDAPGPTPEEDRTLGRLGPPPEPLPIEEITSSMAAVPRFKLVREIGRSAAPPLVRPRTLRLGRDGSTLVIEQSADDCFRLRAFALAEQAVETVAEFPKGLGEHEIDEPVGLAVDGQRQIYLLDASAGAVKKFSSDGRWLDTFDAARSDGPSLARPGDISLDRKGNLYIADTNNDRVVILSAAGEVRKEISRLKNGEEDDELYEPGSVCVTHAGDIYVADSNQNRVVRFDPHGKLVSIFGDVKQFTFPIRVRVSSDGGRIYVADQGGSRVQQFDEEGRRTAVLVVSARGPDHDSIQSSADFDVDREGHVVMLNVLRESIIVLDFLEP